MSQPPSGGGTVDPRTMRDVLGHFASGVTVVTAMTAEGPVGFTCQSFSSLSLEPPLVAFAPARTSRTWPQLREAGRFCVNVLSEEQSELSRQFARSGTDLDEGIAELVERLAASPVEAGPRALCDAAVAGSLDGRDDVALIAVRFC